MIQNNKIIIIQITVLDIKNTNSTKCMATNKNWFNYMLCLCHEKKNKKKANKNKNLQVTTKSIISF